jgi:DNA-binding transcriptional ArsR family regulator
MLVGYNIANPPGYTHNPLIRVGQTITATYGGTSRHFLVTGILNEAGNPNADQVVLINRNTGNTFFHRLGQYDLMIVLARSGKDVPNVIQEMNRVYGKDSFGIVAPAAIMQAQKHTQAGGASFTLEVGFIAMLVSAIGVVTTLYTSVNERRKEIGTMKAIGAKPFFILSVFLSDAVFIGFIGASLGAVSGIGLAYLLSASGASGGGAYIAPIFLPNELLQVWLLSLTVILKYIDRVPGIRYRELLRLTGLANGTLEYNLKTLERTNRVKVFRQDGRRVGYYPIGFRSDEYQILEHIKNKVAKKIVLFILDNALCTFDRILENIKKAASTLSWHLKRLSEAGIISITYGHRRLQLYRVVDSKLVSGLFNLINEQSVRERELHLLLANQ